MSDQVPPQWFKRAEVLNLRLLYDTDAQHWILVSNVWHSKEQVAEILSAYPNPEGVENDAGYLMVELERRHDVERMLDFYEGRRQQMPPHIVRTATFIDPRWN